MRPGEKLIEELSTLLEDTVPTTHEKICIYTGNGLPAGDAAEWVSRLIETCKARDIGRLVVAIKEMVPDYNPSTDLLKRVVEAPRTAPAVQYLERSRAAGY
jgi:FlaA1/EpsC-like NDP-sugar epimerase